MVLAYALLIAFVAAALLAMAGYMRKRIQGKYKEAGDTFGLQEQYKPTDGTILDSITLE